MDYTFLLWLAVILFSTKFLGLLCRRVGLPEVVGALIAGILLGPSCLNFITTEGSNGTFLEFTAELGVVLLMFDAGITTEMEEMKKNIVGSFVVAFIGVIVPLFLGMITFAGYFHMDMSDHTQMLESLFVGVILTATSVSITVQTLREMGKLSGKVGTTILGAAVIDDILGLVVLTVVSGMKDSSVSMGTVFLKILIYAAIIVFGMWVFPKLEPVIKKSDNKRRAGLFALAGAFFFAFISEECFGIADITGAYFLGLMLSQSKVHDYVDKKVEGLSNMFFSAVFFASIGIKVTLGGMSASLWIFAIVLTIVAILTKVVGCGLGAKICGFKWKESVQIGVGMISRGEVALIVADKGRQLGLINTDMFAPVVLVVIVTTLITPILLKLVFKNKEPQAA
ncbi:MAG: cation:proton antiporter [Lachnospiraceae bacterium]|nr:cation:proton antiporter [Lachnospiraceae bacterium]